MTSCSLHVRPATRLWTNSVYSIKKLIATFVLNGVVGGVAFAQGTVNFANIGGGLDAPVHLNDSTTELAGPQYVAGLLAGPNAGSLTLIATAPFVAAGYFVGGARTINSVEAGGIAFIQVDVWDTAIGATFDQARASGFGNAWAQSSVFSLQTGNPRSTPPTTPATLIGLEPMTLNAGPPMPAKLSISRGTVPTGTNTPAVSSQSAMVLTWSDPTFSLQASPNAGGVYTNVVGAASPYTNNIGGSALFFRLIGN